MNTLTRVLGWILAVVMFIAITVLLCDGIACLILSGNEPTILRGGFALFAAVCVAFNLVTVLKALLEEAAE